jgi:hypothetical protein
VFSSHEIKLDWLPVYGVTEYRLERRRAGEVYQTLAVLGASEVDYLDTKLSADTQYTYRIRAFRGHAALAGSEVTARTFQAE